MLFSIITVNLNNAEELRKTIDNVKRHAPRDREYIVIDGSSKDGSVGIIKSESAFIDSWISERDSGIYQAMNKGIARARGTFCLFLNAGDLFRPDNGLDDFKDRGHDIYYSDAIVNSNGFRTVLEYPRSLDANFFVSGMINHQNSMIRRKLFDRVGLYDEELRICSDWLFFLKAAYLHGASFGFLEKPIVEFAAGGISTCSGSGLIIERERLVGIRSVFKDFAPTILELIKYRDSVYGRILATYGRKEFLDFLLRTYRFFARRYESILGRSPKIEGREGL